MARKVCLLVVMMLFCVGSMQAVPAHPSAVKVQQPDGSYVTLQLHGDEWLNYTTTADGYTVVKDQRGYYVYARQHDGQLVATTQVAHDAANRQEAEKTFLMDVGKHLKPAIDPQQEQKRLVVQRGQQQTLKNRRAGGYNYNNFRGLIILVQYNDREFSRSDFYDILNNMVNQPGYTGYDNLQCTGSVFDYFNDNSWGKFQPSFDIVGPVTIDYSQYSANGTSNQEALVNAAVDAADPYVDFSQYDGDGNGKVDMIYFIFAGNGSHYSGNDSRLFWPHRYYVIKTVNANQYVYVYKDGIRLWDYAASTELVGHERYPETIRIDGIGTICHEFSHVLGLPDFYDTDGSGSGGKTITPDVWSVMAAGNYANNSDTPVGYSLFERWQVGFLDNDPPGFPESGNYELSPVSEQGAGYMITTPVENEFFLIENRQQNAFRWDAYLPGSGMLLYQVDMTNMDTWNRNKVNVSPYHPCYFLVRATAVNMNSPYDPFPGAGNVTEVTNDTSPANLLTWEGNRTPCELSQITQVGSLVTFHAEVPQKPDDDIDDPEANGIREVMTGSSTHTRTYYNMQGQRVRPTAKGLLIIDGKKYVQR